MFIFLAGIGEQLPVFLWAVEAHFSDSMGGGRGGGGRGGGGRGGGGRGGGGDGWSCFGLSVVLARNRGTWDREPSSRPSSRQLSRVTPMGL